MIAGTICTGPSLPKARKVCALTGIFAPFDFYFYSCVSTARKLSVPARIASSRGTSPKRSKGNYRDIIEEKHASGAELKLT